jgi:two-component system cell cycle sensor histidine kinase/response regulator CckA
LIAVISDATELKTLEAQFVQSQKMQAIGQLAGGVAHDFNNLLTAISGYCDLLLLRHDKGDPDYSDLIQINQNANRAAALVGQLLAFSRKQTLQPKVMNVDEALADMTHLLNRLVGEKIDLSLIHAENLPNVYADKRQLEQVVMNLVVNARDAMPAGGQVDVYTDEVIFAQDEIKEQARIPKGRYVEVSVKDSGFGIESKNLSHIFDPFFTTKEHGEGTGLGLSTVYGIVKQTGGFIFAESELGEGTTFRVLLPVTAQVEQIAETNVIPASLMTNSLKGITVRLVEDEVPVRSFAARAMAMQYIIVLLAGTA